MYVKAGHPKDAIDMYTKANMYEAAHKVIFTDFTFSLITSMHQASWAFTRVSFSYFFHWKWIFILYSWQWHAWNQMKWHRCTSTKHNNWKNKGNTRKLRGHYCSSLAGVVSLKLLTFFIEFCYFDILMLFSDSWSRLYLTINEPDYAINMYKKIKQVRSILEYAPAKYSSREVNVWNDDWF